MCDLLFLMGISAVGSASVNVHKMWAKPTSFMGLKLVNCNELSIHG
jgi:hypothetical protein